MVVLDGLLYYNEEDSRTLVAINLVTGTEHSRRELSGAVIDGSTTYSYGAETDIDLAVDDGKLYAIYATVASGGRFVVSELNPSTLSIIETWTAPAARKFSYASAFIACGTLYAIDDTSKEGSCFYCTETTVDLRWRLGTTGESDPDLAFTSPGSSGYIGSVQYNPVDGLIYVFRGGNMGRITPTWD
jgi:hypothetical protein